MKKINSENLWEFVNNLATNEKVKFKVFCDDMYVTEIFWNGNYFEWEEGTFTSEGFFNPLYDFVEIIEDNDKLEKIKSLNNVGGSSDLGEFKDKQQLNNHILKDKINKIIDHINKLEDKNV